MTVQSALQPLYTPFITAGHLLREYGVATFQAFMSDTAKEIYKATGAILRLICWLAVLAVFSTLQLGKASRRYYEAEWSRDVSRFVEWIEATLYGYLTSDCAPKTEEPTADPSITTETETATLQTEPSVTEPSVAAIETLVTVTEDTTPAATDLAAVDTETTISAQPTALPDALQSIVNSDSTMTTKLRKLATHYNLTWRNTRGKGKHMKNADLKAALQDLCPEVLAVL